MLARKSCVNSATYLNYLGEESKYVASSENKLKLYVQIERETTYVRMNDGNSMFSP